MDAEKIVKRFNQMEAKRNPYEAIWDKAAQLCSIDSRIYEKDEKKHFRQHVFDSTARNALSYFAASMKSVLIPSTKRWHTLKPVNPLLEQDAETYAYLQDVTKLLFNVRYSSDSKFIHEADILLNNIGLYGFGVFYVGDEVGKGIYYKTIPVNEVYIDTDSKGKLNAVYRKFKLTTRQAYGEYKENSPQAVKEAYENNVDRDFNFLHAVEYRDKRTNLGATSYPIASYHIFLENKEMIKEGGYRVMPYMCPHFLGIPNSPYGDSPAMQCFPDMLTINEISKTMLRTAQLQSNPTFLAGDSLLDAAKLGRAGAIIRGGLDSQGRPRAMPMQYGNDLQTSQFIYEQKKADIERAFLVPLFRAITEKNVEMTATEVEKREAEKAMVLAPMSERILAEWLHPMIEREMDILSQYGMLDNVPDSLMENGSIAIEFQSPFVRLQETDQIVGLYKTIEAVSTMAQTDPSVLDAFDMQVAARKIAEFNDVDHDILRSQEQIDAIGNNRAQQEQAAQMLQGAELLTKSMKNAGLKAKDVDNNYGLQ